MTADVLVVGTGLIGASIALALRDLRDVALADASPAHLSAAVERGCGRPWDGQERARLVVVAVPPSATAEVIQEHVRLIPDATFTHVSSVQAHVERQLESGRGNLRYCGGHPLAGREVSGPQAAAADLFDGRPWIVCPAPFTQEAARKAVFQLARDCGADPVTLAAQEHDAAMALVSHLPQVAASAVAARLLANGGAAAAALSGPGLRDTTRIAASDPRLWLDVLSSNAALLAPLVRDLADDLQQLAAALDDITAQSSRPGDVAARDGADRGAAAAGGQAQLLGPAYEVVADLLRRGNRGRSLVPVKRGEHDQDFVAVAVSVPDRPGELARLLLTAADSGVNVEDVRVEHLRGRPRGVIELDVAAGSAAQAATALTRAGWDVLQR